ncbi:prepilin-type N-terminal cleavage/methylation domain-containing protein [Bacillus sp. B15-48]|uniref:prepilin-type N-terminal cleavage/methylation domain-containing protein n=1 Tax=Bacillus sp. B15-48 TaxID=1548601 RepID=UPI00193FE400|nr:prepilin-type N-terminal cleavage/methylation domain-containing protein [Bacillus sp. B15-48]MBM4762445.1 prepilin-type N-terminal cleavage/methylation domain-containing protein [Bacillus sp. B15-48]
MFQMMKKRLKDQKGLTLIELLAVIVILGIIAAIAIPAIGNIIQNSRVEAARADAVQIINSAKLYSTENTLPTDITTTPAVDESVLQGAGFLESTSIWKEAKVITNSTGQILLYASETEIGSIKVTISGATMDDLNDSNNWKPVGDETTVTIPGS